MAEWLAFYAPYFTSEADAETFVSACEAKSLPDNAAKLIMHQGQRLVTLARDIPSIRPNRESLQVFFLIVCAEAVAKLDAGPGASVGSRQAVRNFFSILVQEPHRTNFGNGFTSHSHSPLGPTDAADVVYDVRCDVAHEGNYWSFTLRTGSTPMLSSVPHVIAKLNAAELIDIVAHGCITAAQRHL